MRNSEVIRQWNLLRALEAARHGATVKQLSKELEVTTRTIWRDMEALQAVGFPLFSDKDGRETRWKLNALPFKGLAELGISFVELCSLYMGRQMVSGMAGAAFGNALAAMCKKLERTLPDKMRQFLDQLPALIEAKAGPTKKSDAKAHDEHVGKLLEASLHRRVCLMRYYSASRNRTKDYTVHPYRLVHAHGGLYVLAWVPEYSEVRTFAVERIKRLSLREEKFELQAELAADAFGHSLGVNRGKPEKIVVVFAPRIARHIRERTWHKSQKLDDLADGSVRMTMNVCSDAALRTWVLGFGAFAKVESPSSLAEEILEQLEEAREAYVPRLDLTISRGVFRLNQPGLPGIRIPRPS
ncbi:MAG TPA: transcriptional regulator [Vicinamibacterales bacterium]|nr:transcriptional regulator [Vicinamibacterales bacterium]